MSTYCTRYVLVTEKYGKCPLFKGYEATCGFTCVTTRWVAHPALQDFVGRLHGFGLPNHATQATWPVAFCHERTFTS